MCVYMTLYAYVNLKRMTAMKQGQETMGKEILGIFFVIEHAHYAWSSAVLFEGHLD